MKSPKLAGFSICFRELLARKWRYGIPLQTRVSQPRLEKLIPMNDHLPPLSALRAFEAAARHVSFSKAAEELYVTPAAISHQIHALEQDLGRQAVSSAQPVDRADRFGPRAAARPDGSVCRDQSSVRRLRAHNDTGS